jgi:hypothetical protein
MNGKPESQVDWHALSRARLKRMSKAADDVLEALRLMGKAGTNPVAQVLKHQGEFVEFDHYPKGDIYDDESASQYYYHAHRSETGEHGHFHTFVRAKGVPTGMSPAPYTGGGERPLGDEAICHLVAVSMDRSGLPVALFTTNRWVTGETFYAAMDVIRTVARFEVDHVDPCLATNRWISALLRLFAPQIEMLVRQRDLAIAEWQARHPDRDAFEDRELEITSRIAIDIDEQAARIDEELARRAA